ncbi:MAG: chemotaxis protein CheR [Magnetococcales bacterium]|nr:chemotaxis protein CheR [Magnetococcales bacterium]
MADNTQKGPGKVWTPGLKDNEFRRLSEFIYKQVGILMPPSKKTMLSARLQKRLSILKQSSFTEYVDWVLDPKHAGEELIHFIDIVTTNKTDFFREPAHFEYMSKTALPALVERFGAGVSRPLKIWSAACSSGEEPYTLAIVLHEFGETLPARKINANVLATDISSRVLQRAKKAVYESTKTDPIAINLKKKYLLRSKDRSKKLVRMGPELRNMIKFRRLNFMDNDYGIGDKMDIVFCRNAIIYFDRPTTEAIVNKFCRHMTPGGYLFIGHSETLNDLKTPLEPVAPTIYQLPG